MVTETKHTYRATELHERLQHGSTDVIRQSLIHCVWRPNEVSLIQGVIRVCHNCQIKANPPSMQNPLAHQFPFAWTSWTNHSEDNTSI